jgi:hypothetical protein
MDQVRDEVIKLELLTKAGGRSYNLVVVLTHFAKG